MTSDDSRRTALAGILGGGNGTGAQDTEKVDAIDDLLADVLLEPPTQINSLGVFASSLIEKQPESAVNLTLALAGSGYPSTRSFAAVLISQLGKFSPGIWNDVIRHLAEDDDRDVRDFAARIFDSQPDCPGLIEYHREFVLGLLGEWTSHEDYLVRRVPARALLGWAKEHPELSENVLALLNPLFEDDNEFVRRNVVSALRSIGKKRPDLVFEFLEAKVDPANAVRNEMMRMILDFGFADRYPEQKNAILKQLP